MPSLHAADAVVIGLTLATIARPRSLRVLLLLWPAWVSFALLATGNHFLLDVVAGVMLGVAGLAVGTLLARGRRRPAVARQPLGVFH